MDSTAKNTPVKLGAVPFPPPQYQPFAPRDFAISLVQWFQKSLRDMPWRRDENLNNPYRILVSEIMLQQTTVAAVTPFFERFTKRFPTVQALAEAPEEDVLAHWAGLGYYSRARNLHSAAKTVMERHAGQFPPEFDAILALPGVGRYTAGAVASIALQQRAPIVDANVARVLSRILPVEGDLKTTANQVKLWDAAARIVEVEEVSPREVNPAMMELGALVCTPKNPRCEVCPVATWCAARSQNRQNEIPFIPPKAALTPLYDACAFATREVDGVTQVLLRRRPDDAKIWWRGMWELPRTTLKEGESEADALVRLGEELGFSITPGDEVAVLKHGVTRYSITLRCLTATIPPQTGSEKVKWFEFGEAANLPLPSVMSSLLRSLAKKPARQLTLL